MKQTSLRTEDAREFSLLARTFGKAASQEKCRSLGKYSELKITRPKSARLYHDTLLFLLAYPDNQTVAKLAKKELERVAACIANDPSLAEQLINSGISGTHVEYSFGLATADWLLSIAPQHTEIDWNDENEPTLLRETLHYALPQAERDGLLSEQLSLQEWLDFSKSPHQTNLSWLVERLDSLSSSDEHKELLYEMLDVNTRWLSAGEFSRTFARFPKRKSFYHPTAQRKPSGSHAILRKRLPKPDKLPSAVRRGLIDAARSSLATRQRETDPVTYANPREVTLFSLERGMSVALFGALPEKRQPLESFFGFMAAKNSVPVAYGGAWILFDRAHIGVNVFPSFRGGESALIFLQVMRTYYQYFGARVFLVEPYQFGAGNKDGIQSGAFWFYYRIGFRPEDQELAAVAEKEWNKIRKSKKYRSPSSVLRALASTMLVLDLRSSIKEKGTELISVSEIAYSISHQINKAFGGNRERACSSALRKTKSLLGVHEMKSWSAAERGSFANLSLLIALQSSVENWPLRDRQSLATIMRAKGGVRERDYLLKTQKHHRFRELLQELSKNGEKIIDNWRA